MVLSSLNGKKAEHAPVRVLRSQVAIFALVLGMLLALLPSSPSYAHKDHVKPAPTNAATVARGQVPASPTAMHSTMGDHVANDAEGAGGFSVRLLDWLGRLHPILVHFPIAFFPAALFTAVVGRRRPAFAKPVQFLVVSGGILAPVAAVLGWLDALDAKVDPLLSAHQWLGTGIGIAAPLLAFWAWKRPEEDRGPLMLGSLALITTALIVQGWFGGALVHGIDHLDW